MIEEPIKRSLFELLDNGDVVHNTKKGQQIVLAKYDSDEGILTYENESMHLKFREQIDRSITQNEKGERNKNKIVAFRIKGRPVDEIKNNEPPRPKKSKLLGDKTPEVVDWYHRWRFQEFLVRYGVKLDADGNPVIVHGIRRDMQYAEADANGQIAAKEIVVDNPKGYLANRGTHLTFTDKEVVGHEDEEEDTED